MLTLVKHLLHNGRPRRTFSSWQIPKSDRDRYGISDGDEISATLRLGGKFASDEFFHITSGGELYLPSQIADQVKLFAQNNPGASISFQMRIDPSPADDIKRIEDEPKDPTETTRRALIAARVGQGKFRTKLMLKYGRKCAVTGVSVPGLLRASHIKPWSKSSNEERLSADNGLLLVANLDAAFDAKLISFGDEGAMLFHRRLGSEPHSILGIKKGSKLTRPPSSAQRKYLKYHRRAAGPLHS